MDLSGVHSMLIGMHSGMLTLAAGCVLITVVARLNLKKQETNENRALWPTNSFIGKLARYAEPTAYLAGIGGIIGLVLSAIVGFYIWPIDFITSSPIGLSKVMFSVFAMELWIVFVFARSRYGENLWKKPGAAALYACLGIFGFLFVVVAGSFGGHMAGTGSIIDPLYAVLGIVPETFGVTGSGFMILVVSFSFVFTAVPMAVFNRFQK